MKFLGVAAIASLLSLTSALPIKISNDTVPNFEMAGINGPQPDIHNQIPLVTTRTGQLAIPDSKEGDSGIQVTIKPWMEGQLVGINSEDDKENGDNGYLAKTDKDKIYDLMYGKLPDDTSGVLSKGFYPAEDHPAGGVEGIEQLFYSNGDVEVGSFVYESDSASPHPVKWYASDGAIPKGYTQVWLTRPLHV